MSEIARRATKASERELLCALLEEVQHFRSTTTEFGARFFGQAVNNVLSVETVTFDSTGYVMRSYHATAGAVEVRNLDDTNSVTVVSGAAGTVPAQGIGVYVIPPNTVQVVNIASTTFSIFGTNNEKVSFQVFADGGRDGGS